MRKLLTGIVICLILFCIHPFAFAETIRDFEDTIRIYPDGKITVEETITYDFESSAKHGIYRIIPTIKSNDQGKSFRLMLSDIQVTDQTGIKMPFTVTTEETMKNIKIGDPNVTITGVKQYTISYTVEGALTYFSDHDELYWNVTGNAWVYPIRTAHATIILEQTDPNIEMTSTCYTGKSGSTEKHCLANAKGNKITIETSGELNANEGLTAVAGFPKGLVTVVEPKEVKSPLDNPLVILGIFLLIFAWYIICPIAIVLRWWQKGRAPKATIGTPNVWFSPPKTVKLRELTPIETGSVYDERVDNRDIASLIVDLARRGYITIIEDTKHDVTLKKKDKRIDTELMPFEKNLYTLIFTDGDAVQVKKLHIATSISEVKSKVFDQLVQDGFLTKNPEPERVLYQMLCAFGVITVNIPVMLIAVFFGYSMSKKTVLGSNAKAVAKALLGFLKSQDKQYKFQAQQYILFEKMLPYAVAFGVQKEWAKRFENLELPNPDWYIGPTGTHSSVFFVSQLSSSLNTINGSLSPTNSSSGFSSGFSGGSSGGGGGGGGGGSW